MACTGVGVLKPAVASACLRCAEMLKSAKCTPVSMGSPVLGSISVLVEVMVAEVAPGWVGVVSFMTGASSVAEFKI